MGISIEEFSKTYPCLYHMAEANTWESIKKHGLLSTTALLDLYKINGQQRTSIESKHRPDSVIIQNEKYGKAVIRDQKPLSESALKECLIDLDPVAWYRILNGRVFFWVTEDRLKTLLSARAYKNTMHCVITIETQALLPKHIENVQLSPINSGSTLYTPIKRGLKTFSSLSEYPFEERRKLRGAENAVAELTINHGVQDIEEFTLSVKHIKGDKIIETIYER